MSLSLPMSGELAAEEIRELSAEVRELARARDAVILAHNYQLPEIQDVADFVGDSLALSQQAARAEQAVIAFCGVHFMAETASILAPSKTVLIPDPDAGCSLSDSITAAASGTICAPGRRRMISGQASWRRTEMGPCQASPRATRASRARRYAQTTEPLPTNPTPTDRPFI